MQLVEHDPPQRAEQIGRVGRGENERELLGRGQQNVRRVAALALALGGRRVARAGLDPDRQRHLGDRRFEVARDVHGERLERGDVKRVQPALAANMFRGANRGKHIAVSAPGVEVLVPAPNGAYQFTTGTSVAAAEVSGIAALLIERNPALKPADVRRILTSTAKDLGPKGHKSSFGSGLVNALRAVTAAGTGGRGQPGL